MQSVRLYLSPLAPHDHDDVGQRASAHCMSANLGKFHCEPSLQRKASDLHNESSSGRRGAWQADVEAQSLAALSHADGTISCSGSFVGLDSVASTIVGIGHKAASEPPSRQPPADTTSKDSPDGRPVEGASHSEDVLLELHVNVVDAKARDES
eukprot:1251799-Amphidinium_carterae.1